MTAHRLTVVSWETNISHDFHPRMAPQWLAACDCGWFSDTLNHPARTVAEYAMHLPDPAL